MNSLGEIGAFYCNILVLVHTSQMSSTKSCEKQGFRSLSKLSILDFNIVFSWPKFDVVSILL